MHLWREFSVRTYSLEEIVAASVNIYSCLAIEANFA